MSTKAKKAKKKPSQNPYYTPVHPLVRLRQRLEDGSVPTEWLRYSHKRDRIPEDVLQLVEIAERIHSGSVQLDCLVAGKHALLMSSLVQAFESRVGFIRSIEDLAKARPGLLIEIRDRLLDRCRVILSNGENRGN